LQAWEFGLTNSRGYSIGFDHLVNLGINTVHLMPVQEMLHWPKDEWKKAFSKDKYMIEQGIANENYDWGYRTSHSFAIESRYRKKVQSRAKNANSLEMWCKNFMIKTLL
jgi:pullulanase